MRYLLFGMNAMSLQARAQITYVIRADVTMTTGVDPVQPLTIANTGPRTTICIRYIP